MQHDLLTVDLGPEFFGMSSQIAGRIVCVATPRIYTDATARRVVKELVKRQGGDCGSCSLADCPISRARESAV